MIIVWVNLLNATSLIELFNEWVGKKSLGHSFVPLFIYLLLANNQKYWLHENKNFIGLVKIKFVSQLRSELYGRPNPDGRKIENWMAEFMTGGPSNK